MPSRRRSSSVRLVDVARRAVHGIASEDGYEHRPMRLTILRRGRVPFSAAEALAEPARAFSAGLTVRSLASRRKASRLLWLALMLGHPPQEAVLREGLADPDSFLAPDAASLSKGQCCGERAWRKARRSRSCHSQGRSQLRRCGNIRPARWIAKGRTSWTAHLRRQLPGAKSTTDQSALDGSHRDTRA
jgi:hypothetical protein